MAYSKGDVITAATLNGFLTTMRTVYGQGTGDRGYGMTTITQADVAAAAVINSAHWTNLRGMMANVATHQGSVSTIVPANLLEVTDVITAHETGSPSLNAYDLDSIITELDTNRLTAAAGGMTLTSAHGTVTRATAWTSIDGAIKVDFGSEDAARYFFNSGGEIRVRFAHAGGVSDRDDAWRTMFTSIGTLAIKARSSTRSGSISTSFLDATKGYYTLTDTNQPILNGLNIGGGAYASNDIVVSAKTETIASVRGANGSALTVTAALADQSGGADVNSGTQMIIDIYRATGIGIVLPTLTTPDGF